MFCTFDHLIGQTNNAGWTYRNWYTLSINCLFTVEVLGWFVVSVDGSCLGDGINKAMLEIFGRVLRHYQAML